MSASPESKHGEDLAPLVGTSLLFFLVLGWIITFLFSASEPPFVAFVVGMPTALATPLVTGTLLVLLRRSKHVSLMHRFVFYGSVTLLTLWCVGLVAGVYSD